jgi:hypothetical protein
MSFERLNDREQAIAVAEAHVRAARVGEPQLLNAGHRSGCEAMSDSAEERWRSLGATDEHVAKLKEIWRNRTARPRWEVRFLLHDSRYTDGITIAFVASTMPRAKPNCGYLSAAARQSHKQPLQRTGRGSRSV